MRAILTMLLAVLLVGSAWPGERSRAVRAEFQRQQPCPATGAKRGPCRGYVVDHVVPLCAGGADHPANLQWQTVEQGKLKDREEVRQCRRRAR